MHPMRRSRYKNVSVDSLENSPLYGRLTDVTIAPNISFGVEMGDAPDFTYLNGRSSLTRD
ncbi:hypothetical protein H6F77_19735 [Microcoleus sp. FACHB-831]|uniref:hypothetical protein n=1 Tax=Microcoleus sp. FACHB-831 TaxID=2692827 RepID=UPI001687C1CD|nr:hypothetical protein [Microcoleus sp. FACHB-831]MBD1923286.1 hypothetical protein [Microcoleus sp. FACHB-831]